ncbi:MAG: hypothetical protein IK092_06345, partial [Muribaculaceae bacterium]|nr:hypothetical protein [Muribaculaceae bacterium]
MKKLSFLLLAMLALGVGSSQAKDMADWVVRMTLCQVHDDSTTEELVDFMRNDDGSWTLADFAPTPMMEMRIHIYFNYSGENSWDEWHGGPDGDESFAITASMLGTQIQGARPGQTFHFKHGGMFTINLSKYDIDYNSFTVTGGFTPGYYLTGAFNDWGETEFTLVGDEYRLSQTFYGEFLIKDQNDLLYGGTTDDERYTIEESQPSVTLNGGDSKKHLFLANEGDYTLAIKNGVLSVGNWPSESHWGVIRGTTGSWDGELTEFNMNWDWVTGKYVTDQVFIPEGFRCKVAKHSSFTSVEDRWFGPEGAFNCNVEGTQDVSLSENSDRYICFEGDGNFKFSVDPDFTSLHIEGGYIEYPSYYLIGEFNNWSTDNMVEFTRNGNVFTATQTLGGEFLIIDGDGNYLGGATTGSHYELHEGWPSVTLANDQQGKKNIFIDNEAEYTFTITDGVLTVSGWTDEVITCKLLGATSDDWDNDAMNFAMNIDNATGSYVSGVLSIPEGYRFQVVKHSSR